jgi:hypothetical protein
MELEGSHKLPIGLAHYQPNRRRAFNILIQWGGQTRARLSDKV